MCHHALSTHTSTALSLRVFLGTSEFRFCEGRWLKYFQYTFQRLQSSLTSWEGMSITIASFLIVELWVKTIMLPLHFTSYSNYWGFTGRSRGVEVFKQRRGFQCCTGALPRSRVTVACVHRAWPHDRRTTVGSHSRTGTNCTRLLFIFFVVLVCTLLRWSGPPMCEHDAGSPGQRNLRRRTRWHAAVERGWTIRMTHQTHAGQSLPRSPCLPGIVIQILCVSSKDRILGPVCLPGFLVSRL